MDWGLVLISQGIPAVIERVEPPDPLGSAAPDTPLLGPPDATTTFPDPPRRRGRRSRRNRSLRRDPRPSRAVVWHLRIDPQLIDRARVVIEQYRLEDRRFDWQRSGAAASAGVGPMSWAPGALGWVVAVCAFHGLLPMALRALGWVEVSAVRQGGQWWRVLTATWLHADVAHLVSNVATGGLTLGLAMGRYGPGTALCLSLIAGAAANVPGVLLRDPASRALGASGVVMATLGLLAGHAVVWWRISRHASKPVWISLGAAGFLFLSLGVDPSSDVLAHLGGFVAGIVLGAVAAWFRWGRFDKVWAWGYVLLALGPWIWALMRAPR